MESLSHQPVVSKAEAVRVMLLLPGFLAPQTTGPDRSTFLALLVIAHVASAAAPQQASSITPGPRAAREQLLHYYSNYSSYTSSQSQLPRDARTIRGVDLACYSTGTMLL